MGRTDDPRKQKLLRLSKSSANLRSCSKPQIRPPTRIVSRPVATRPLVKTEPDSPGHVLDPILLGRLRSVPAVIPATHKRSSLRISPVIIRQNLPELRKIYVAQLAITRQIFPLFYQTLLAYNTLFNGTGQVYHADPWKCDPKALASAMGAYLWCTLPMPSHPFTERDAPTQKLDLVGLLESVKLILLHAADELVSNVKRTTRDSRLFLGVQRNNRDSLIGYMMDWMVVLGHYGGLETDQVMVSSEKLRAMFQQHDSFAQTVELLDRCGADSDSDED